MPGETHAREVGGAQFRMQALGAKKAGHVALRLGKALAELFKVDSREALAAVARDIVQRLSEEDLDFVTDALSAVTQYELVDPLRPESKRWVPLAQVFDQAFAAKFSERLVWMMWGLEVNFGDFFGVLRERFAAEASASTHPRTEIGGSGDSSSASA